MPSPAEMPPSPARRPRRIGRPLLVVLAALLPLLLFAVAMLLLFTRQQEQAIRRLLHDGAETAAHAVDRAVGEQFGLLMGLASSRALDTGDLAAFRLDAQRLWELHPEWRTIILTDERRQLLNLRFRPDEPPQAIRDPESLAHVWTTHRPWVGNLSQGYVAFRVPVLRSARLAYTIAVPTSPSFFRDVLGAYPWPQGWAAMIVGGDGVVIAATPGTPAAAGGPLPPALRPRAGENVERHAGQYVASASVGPTGWQLLVLAPTAAVEQPFLRARMLLYLCGLVAAAVTAGLVLALGSAWATRREAIRLRAEIAERQRAEGALRESEQRLHLALEAAQAGTWEWDLRTDENHWSEELWSLYGLTPGSSSPSYEAWRQAIHPEDRSQTEAAVRQAAHDGTPFFAEWRVCHPDGQERWLMSRGLPTRDAQGAVVRYLGIVFDITERKRAEETLRQSEERHRRLFEDATEGIVLADAETGEILDCNRAITLLSGYAREELIGRPQHLHHPPDERIGPVTRGFALHRGEREGDVLSATLRTKSGTSVPVEIKANILDLGGRRILQGFFRDVTAELRYRHERETTLQLLRLLNDQSHSHTHDLLRSLTGYLQKWTGCEAVGVRLKEGDDYPYFETRGFPGEFVAAENRLCLQGPDGQPVRNGAGDPVLECMCGTVLAGRTDPTRPFFSARGSFWSNNTTRLLAGTTEADRRGKTRNRCNAEGYQSVALIPLRQGARTFGLLQFNDRAADRFTPDLIAIALAQRQTQAALRESEERYRTLIEASPVAILVVQDFRYVFANPAAVRLLGFARTAELVGMPLLDRIHSDSASLVVEWMAQAVAGTPNSPAEIWLIRRDGSPLHTESMSVLIQFAGRPAAIIMALDTTERRRLEAELRQAQKMEAVGQLAGGVAHDFNNILTATLMRLEALQEEPTASEAVRAATAELEQDASRAAALTRQLLLFSRRQVAQIKPLELNRLLANLLKMLRRLLGEHIGLEFAGDSDDLWVEADTGMLEQVVTNLAVNARDAMPDGGRLTIRTRAVTLTPDEAGARPEARPGPFVCLEVSDTGCGIDEATLPQIFDPFFTTKGVGKGTGLGLATAYGIVAQHRGWIEVESAVGQGSAFRLFLPLVRPAAAEESEAGPAAAMRGEETILLVEDERSVRHTTALFLRRLGYRVLEAASGPEGLAAWQEQQCRIDVLLSDMVMPGGMNGLELASRLREAQPSLGVVLTSGYSQELIEQGGESLAGAVYLAKPFRPADAARAVRASLDQAKT